MYFQQYIHICSFRVWTSVNKSCGNSQEWAALTGVHIAITCSIAVERRPATVDPESHCRTALGGGQVGGGRWAVAGVSGGVGNLPRENGAIKWPERVGYFRRSLRYFH